EEDKIEKVIMIRPREGDFCYSEDEFLQMKEEIKIFKNFKIDGFVFGILDKNENLDIERMKELIELAKPFDCTLHRAIDYSKDYEEKIEDIINIGFKRILTSGQTPKAPQGLDLIEKIQKKYGKEIEIMAGSGVTYQNIEEIYKKTNIRNFHISARIKESSNEKYMDYFISDYNLIKQAREAIDRLK